MRVQSDKEVEKGGWLHLMSDPLPEVSLPEKKSRASSIPTAEWERRARKMYESPDAAKHRRLLSASLQVDVSSLEAMRVGVGYDDRYNEIYSSWPHRDDLGRVVGITRRWLSPVIYQGERRSKMTAAGSRVGLFYSRDWHDRRGPVLVPEGPTCVAALMSVGLCAIGRFGHGGGSGYLADMTRRTSREIVIVAENDYKPGRCSDCNGCLLCWPGKYGAIEFARRLSKDLGREVWWATPPLHKDAREWVAAGADSDAVLSGLRRQIMAGSGGRHR